MHVDCLLCTRHFLNCFIYINMSVTHNRPISLNSKCAQFIDTEMEVKRVETTC